MSPTSAPVRARPAHPAEPPTWPGSARWARFGDPDVALALASAIGSTQGLLVLLAPQGPVAHRPTLTILSVFGFVCAPLIWLARGHLRSWSRHALLGVGTVVTTAGVWACGPNPSSMNLPYVYSLIVLYSAAFFPARHALGHVVAIGICYAAGLAITGTPSAPVQWGQAMGALGVIAVIVVGFAQQLRRTANARTHALFHDQLTGLANRALFLNRLEGALPFAGRSGSSVALLCLNVDEFRSFNASMGKEAGDALLVAIARRLVRVTRAEDTVARLGGDDFAVLIEWGQMPETALAMAHRISHAIRRPYSIAGVTLTLEASIGIAWAEAATVVPTDLLRDADVALYMAKKRGKGQVQLVRPGMQDEAMEHLTLVADLRQAVERGEFELHFQAIVSAADGRPMGAEALVRWNHPRRGTMPPDCFIPLAESQGLIVPLGRWVLGEACRQAKTWLDAGVVCPAFHVSVNVSAVQLAHPSLVDDVAAALHESGLPPVSLVLEVTESSVLLDTESGRERLLRLTELGVRLSLDDFGTGYSSLHRLRNLPVSVLKIDKSFVDHVARGHQDRVVVETVITMGHNLGAVVVAEGVETADQLGVLRELGCDAIQGYFYARPLPPDRAAAHFRQLRAAAVGPGVLRLDHSSSGW